LKRKELEQKYKTNFFLVAPIFFIDDYEIEHWVKTKVWGIYFTLGNLPVSELDSPRHKYLICLVPPKACLNDVINTVIVSRCQQLEKGFSLKIGDTALNICGSVQSILSDHIGQATIACMTGPTGLHPSRSTLATKDQLPLTMYDKQPLPDPRDSLKTLAEINEFLSMAPTPGTEKARALGLKYDKPCLWSCNWAAPNFFERFGSCYMHGGIEGILKTMILYICAKYGFEMIKQLNQRVIEFPHFPTLERLCKGIVKVKRPQKLGRAVLKIATFTATQIETFIQISPFCFMGLISKQDFEAWMDRLDADRLLLMKEFPKEKLQELQEKLDKATYSFKATLCTDSGVTAKSFVEVFAPYGGYRPKGNSNTISYRYPSVAAEAPDPTLLDSGKFTSKFPNLENHRNFPAKIAFHGAVCMMDTKYHETGHAQGKRLKPKTNLQRVARDVLIGSSKITAEALSHLEIPDAIRKAPAKHRPDMAPFGMGTVQQWRKEKQELLTVRQQMGIDVDLETSYAKFRGFYLGGKKTHCTRGYFEICDLRIKGSIRKEAPIVARLEMVANVKSVTKVQSSWARICVLSYQGNDCYLDCPRYVEDFFTWIPLYLPERIYVKTLVPIVAHPLPSQKGVLVKNIWMRKTWYAANPPPSEPPPNPSGTKRKRTLPYDHRSLVSLLFPPHLPQPTPKTTLPMTPVAKPSITLPPKPTPIITALKPIPTTEAKTLPKTSSSESNTSSKFPTAISSIITS
jgi:hypothetical protein